jgi:hypothetical protein
MTQPTHPQTIDEVLRAIMARYPSVEAEKTLTSYNMRGGNDSIFRKRLDNLLGNLPHPQSDEEREERRRWADVVYVGAPYKDDRFVVRVIKEEHIQLMERAADQGITLSQLVRNALGLH